eukprot:768372-Hanusia_phi.AAC.6
MELDHKHTIKAERKHRGMICHASNAAAHLYRLGASGRSEEWRAKVFATSHIVSPSVKVVGCAWPRGFLG